MPPFMVSVTPASAAPILPSASEPYSNDELAARRAYWSTTLPRLADLYETAKTFDDQGRVVVVLAHVSVAHLDAELALMSEVAQARGWEIELKSSHPERAPSEGDIFRVHIKKPNSERHPDPDGAALLPLRPRR